VACPHCNTSFSMPVAMAVAPGPQATAFPLPASWETVMSPVLVLPEPEVVVEQSASAEAEGIDPGC